VMALTSQSTIGKIAAMWLPIMTFFAQGFEHSVVNMFVIPAGMLLGARVGQGDWWLWNQIPVTLGNVVGGMILTGLALHVTHRAAPAREVRRPTAVALGGEMHGALSHRSCLTPLVRRRRPRRPGADHAQGAPAATRGRGRPARPPRPAGAPRRDRAGNDDHRRGQGT